MTGIETGTRITRDKIRTGGIRLHHVQQDSIGIRTGAASETRTRDRSWTPSAVKASITGAQCHIGLLKFTRP